MSPCVQTRPMCRTGGVCLLYVPDTHPQKKGMKVFLNQSSHKPCAEEIQLMVVRVEQHDLSDRTAVHALE